MAYLISALLFDRLTPLKVAKSLKCSITLKSGKRTLCYGQNPMIFLISSISFSTSNPKASAQPEVMSSNPVSMEIVLVFPAPFCPSNAKIYP